MAPRGQAFLSRLPALPLLHQRRWRRADVVEMVELAGLRGHDVRRLGELLTLSLGRNEQGPCHSPCRHDLRPTPRLIRGMSHPLLLGTQVVRTIASHFALSTSDLSCNLPPPLPQELRPRSELERSRRARGPPCAEDKLLGCCADGASREVRGFRRLPRPQHTPPSPSSPTPSSGARSSSL